MQPAFHPDKNRKAFIKNKQSQIKLVISSSFAVYVPQMDSGMLKTIPSERPSQTCVLGGDEEGGTLETQT